MRSQPHILPLNWRCTPLQALQRWPAQRPLVMLHSGRVHEKWARRTIMATPKLWYAFDHKYGSQFHGEIPPALSTLQFTHDPLTDVESILSATSVHDAVGPEWTGGWIGYFSYELGGLLEPRAVEQSSAAKSPSDWPLIALAWCPTAAVFDHVEHAWSMIAMDEHETIELSPHAMFDESQACIDSLEPQMSRAAYMQRVQRTIEYIAAGDIFQANIAQPFTGDFTGHPRGLAHALFTTAKPWYGAYLELPTPTSNPISKIRNPKSILSLSPELFLQIDPHTRRVVTRPIKGTRPAKTDATHLTHSAKDAAELHMIVDLMRNDLGRVCEFGSVHVNAAREIESHPTVHHGVGEVIGTLREDVRFTDVLRAAFPGGSVTGAPKIRAMQIIDELEPFQRGPYCGSIGCIGDNGSVTLNIAIRTLMLEPHAKKEGGTFTYFAGAGIVADSNPAREYEETLDKAAVLSHTQSHGDVGCHALEQGRSSMVATRQCT